MRRVVLLLAVVAVAVVSGWYVWNRVQPVEEADGPSGPETEPAMIEQQPMGAGTSVPEQPADAVEADTAGTVKTDDESKDQQGSGGNSPQNDWQLLLVNSQTLLPDNFTVDLVTVDDPWQVDARIADDLLRMFAQAKEDGINLMICSAYRSPEKQQELFQNKVNEYLNAGREEEEAVAATATIIAVPKTSEHHTGLAVDIVTPSYQTLDSGFADTPAFQWLNQNAHKYGFILRYPESKQSITGIIYEPWHYRYVGTEHAAKIKESGVCLEEYLYVQLRDELITAAEEEAVNEPEDE